MFKKKKIHLFQYYKYFCWDLYGDFIYKKKITWIIYNSILNLTLNKPLKKKYGTELFTKNTNYSNSLIQLKRQKNVVFLNRKQNKLNTNYIYSIYAKRFKLFFNNISSNNIRLLCKKNIKQYKYNFISFLILWELRLDILLYRLHLINNLRSLKQKLKFTKIFLINGKIINNMNYSLKIGDVLSIRFNKRNFFLKKILNKQIYQFEWFLIKNLFNFLGKKSIFFNKLKNILNYNNYYIKKLNNNKIKHIYYNIKLEYYYYKTITFFKQKRPYRINNILPLLYNYPIYTEVNWNNFNITVIPINLINSYQIPYKTDLFWESIYYYYKR